MKLKDRELLLRDLSARLQCGVKYVRDGWNYEWDQEISVVEILEDIDKDGYINYHKVYTVDDIKPYLRPMSSMTEEEYEEFFAYYHNIELAEVKTSGDYLKAAYLGDDAKYEWLNRHHFDYRYLIEKGLALEAPEGMYEGK